MLNSLLHIALSPRGRSNRKGLLVFALVLLGLQALVYGPAWLGLYDFRAPGVQAFEIAILWLCLVAAIKRLHDIGYGAIWVLIGFGAKVLFALLLVVGALVAFGEASLDEGTTVYWSIVGCTMTPAVLGTLWLHLAPGQLSHNRYGPPPGSSGFGPEHPNRRPTLVWLSPA